jgi:type IV secretory pathway VirB3-like protein
MRGIGDIFFIRRGKTVACKKCGCKYEVPQKIHWLISLFVYAVLMVLGFYIWIFIMKVTETLMPKTIVLQFVISIITSMTITLVLAQLIFTMLSSVKKTDKNMKDIRSFLSFKCQKCGRKVWKTRGIDDIFSGKTRRIIACKKCGCRYRVSDKITFLPSYLIITIMGFFGACILFASFGGVNALFPKMDFLLQIIIAIVVGAVIAFTLFEFVLIIIYSVDKISVDKVNDKE